MNASFQPLNILIIDIRCNFTRDFTIGYIYKCYPCDFTLDVNCAISTTSENETQRLKVTERESMLCFLSQHHKLSFFDFRHQTGTHMKCSICRQPILGPTYRCDYCGYVLHESCVGFPWEIQLPILEGFPLQPFVIDFHRKCSACYSKFDFYSIVYSCFYQQRFYLEFHLQCANSLRRAIEVESHEHRLFYFGAECQKLFANMNEEYSTDPFFRCNKCDNPCNGVPFFHCILCECEINLHLECVPIPHSIKSKCHIHPLSLKDCFVEDDSGEYYCDVCEEERYPEDHIYYCKECHGLFIAHIECVLNQVKETAPKAEASSDLELNFKRSGSKGIIVREIESETDFETDSETELELEKGNSTSRISSLMSCCVQ
ncbi:hypothetical protein DITRI_Ditri20bG0040300 [Diplodiscus trichospermus]